MQTSGITDLTGRVLADRYRLLAPLGTGASGRVYLGLDLRLGRRVAVKVLHAALGEDVGFLRRFEAEARVAASLHHPHIVAVYDWGQDGHAFMVLELLEGGSLRGLLDTGSRLSPAQAAAVGAQVASALAHAHARGLVHRDVKPANLLFDEHGAVRVADFGLARALAEASWTEPAGAVLGTARYAAPEQVTGVPLDGRADQYSLALVLVEAVTGSVPFAGETTVGTLLARVDAFLQVPDELGPLADVLERAGRPDPAQRHSDAVAFEAALIDAAHRLPRPAPLALPGPDDGLSDPHPTELTPRVAPAVPGSAPASHAPPRTDRRTRRRILPVLILLLALVAVAASVFAGAVAASPRLPVPNLVGASEATARQQATSLGFRVRVDRRVAADDPLGSVVGQSPDPGTWLGRAKALRLVVSSGPPPVEVPGVAGRTESQARAELEKAGFSVEATKANHEELASGLVVDQDPEAGAQAVRGSVARLVVSEGPKPVAVPNVVGKLLEDALEALRDRRFLVEERQAFSEEIERGEIIRQDPVGGEEASRGSKVVVVVSRGPDRVKVPDVRGLDLEDAASRLERAGFDVELGGGYRPGRPVRRQEPSAGTEARRGTTVTLFL
ncbi:MAG: PASTA domain-containing protein [Acidimicrobiia bacterium]